MYKSLTTNSFCRHYCTLHLLLVTSHWLAKHIKLQTAMNIFDVSILLGCGTSLCHWCPVFQYNVWILKLLKMKPHSGLKMWGTSHPVPWHQIPKEWRPRLHCCKNLKPHVFVGCDACLWVSTLFTYGTYNPILTAIQWIEICGPQLTDSWNNYGPPAIKQNSFSEECCKLSDKIMSLYHLQLYVHYVG